MVRFARQPLSQALFSPPVVVAISGVATLIFVMTMLLLPRFAGEGRFYLFYRKDSFYVIQ